jgi:type I restriction enzyme, S subunit
LSNLPEGWKAATLGDVLIRVIGGGTPSRNVPSFFNGDIPWFTVKDMKSLRPKDAQEHISVHAVSASATNLIDANTVIVATRIALGKAIRPTVPCAINQDLKALHFGTGVNADFMLYWVCASERKIQDLGSGTTVSGIRLETLHGLELDVPPASEQTRIVAKLEELLSELDAGVAELKAAQKKLTQYRQSLLKAAVEGALTAEWRKSNPSAETGAQLLERILVERRARWEAKQLAKFKEQGKEPPKDWQSKYPAPVKPDLTGLPELPDGWVWTSIGQCFQVGVGATPSRKELNYWNGSIPWVSSGEIRFNRIEQTKETITTVGLNNSSTQLNPIGSVLLGMIGEGKTRGQVSILGIQAANNQNCAAIWVTETEIAPEYVYYWLWSQYENTRKGSSGNNQPALNKSIVERIAFPLPPIKEITTIVDLLADVFVQIEMQEQFVTQTLKKAEAQRKNILKSAFSGELVKQDPNDESASQLLATITANRGNLNGDGRGRKVSRPLEKVT